MKFIVTISFLFALIHSGYAQVSDSTNKPLPVIADTTPQNKIVEDVIIDEIIEKQQTPSKDKVQYFSQLTRYGFKNLFSKYSYNSSLPYSSQVNPNAENYMQDYLRVHSKSLIRMKSWGASYFNLIDNIFAQYGLPKELKYLAVIESNLSAGATSWVGAGGPWQFMPYTARDYGLVVNGSFDERRDYYKSTHAAARYLVNLYRQMNRDWLLVIAAYNGGPGRVFDAMRKSGSKNFWALQYYLPEESRNHVKKFIATHYIMEGAGQPVGGNYTFQAGLNGVSNPYNNMPALTEDELKMVERQMVSGKFNSAVIAKNLSMPTTVFNRYNPNFDQMLGTNGQFELMLPSDKMELFLVIKYQILNECVQLLLDDSNIPNNRTVYPPKYGGRKRKS